MSTASDQFSKSSYTYLATGEVATVPNFGTAGAPRVDLTNTYDLLGRRTRVAASVEGTADFQNDYLYTLRGEMTQVIQQQQTATRTVTPKRVNFTYNLAGERTSVTRAANVTGT